MDDYVIRVRSHNGIWLNGTIDDNTFGMKVADEKSGFSIDDGRVFKLYVKDSAEREIIVYERGWEKYPKTDLHKELLAALLMFADSLPTHEVWQRTMKWERSFLVTEDCVLEYEVEP